MGISDKRLKEPFQRVQTLDSDISYIKEAKEIAEMIQRGEEIPQDKLERVRLQSIQRNTILKGDFVINCFLDVMQFNRWKKGKSIDTNEKEVYKLFRNHFSKELSVTEYCLKNRMTRTKYYRIRNCNVKNEEHKAILQRIRDEVAKEYEM